MKRSGRHLGYFQSDVHFADDCTGTFLNCPFLECEERWAGGS